MAAVLPSRESTGVLLGILILADVFAAGHYGLKYVNNQQLKPVIGIIVLAMLALNYWSNKKDDQNILLPHKWWFIAAKPDDAAIDCIRSCYWNTGSKANTTEVV